MIFNLSFLVCFFHYTPDTFIKSDHFCHSLTDQQILIMYLLCVRGYDKTGKTTVNKPQGERERQWTVNYNTEWWGPSGPRGAQRVSPKPQALVRGVGGASSWKQEWGRPQWSHEEPGGVHLLRCREEVAQGGEGNERKGIPSSGNRERIFKWETGTDEAEDGGLGQNMDSLSATLNSLDLTVPGAQCVLFRLHASNLTVSFPQPALLPICLFTTKYSCLS